ncbi:MAG: hypothetical protein LPL29_00875 [Alphaproteobacteria bacterium]|nr:hypothetical protein [Alphaproteobacteria bacterium]
MELDATAQALVGEQPPEEKIEEPVTLEEPSEDDALAAVYRKANQQEEEDEEPAEPVEDAEEKPEDKAEGEEKPPSGLPYEVRAAWSAIPKEARDAILASQQEMSRKLADQGRLVQGIGPIRDVLVSAAKEIPALMNMRPEQVASEILELARFSQAFDEKPVETLVGLARKHGIEDKLRAAFSGQPQKQQGEYVGELKKEIAALKGQLAQFSDPEFFRTQVSQVTQQERVLGEVSAFASQAEHWADVEPHMPKAIPLAQAKLGEGASEKDVLQAAYDLALTLFLPDAKAKGEAAAKAAEAPDPQRAAAVEKAKSVNVKGAVTGKGRELSEDERLAMIYRRASQK